MSYSENKDYGFIIPEFTDSIDLNSKTEKTLKLKYSKCENCASSEYEEVNNNTLKCCFCGTEYINEDSKIEVDIFLVNFADGRLQSLYSSKPFYMKNISSLSDNDIISE